MSYDGFERPFPKWFPYLFVAILVMGAAVVFTVGGSKASPSGQPQDELNVARHKQDIVTKRRA